MQEFQNTSSEQNSGRQTNEAPLKGWKPDSYFVGKHNGSKIRKIAKRIHEIASNADPSMRQRVLNEATVRYNNQIMTLQQFLDNCQQQMDAPQNPQYYQAWVAQI